MDEFSVKLAPNVSNKRYNVFKLHKDDNVTWTEVKMRRENDNQPWQIKLGNARSARRFKAIKEGGVGDNASYFVFYKPNEKSNTYEVCPVEEWYNVSATQRYKTLTAEEAEQKFEQRHKMLNLFSVMHLKKTGEAGEDDGPGYDRRSGFKVSEMDDWNDSNEDEGASGEDGEDDDKKRNRKKKGVKKEKEDPDEAPEEAKEDSDEGDFEQREVDYMSSSSSESDEIDEDKDETDVKGIAEEEALRDLLSTDEEDEGDGVQQKNNKANEAKGVTSGLDPKQDPDANGSEESSDSDDYDVDDDKLDSMIAKKGLPPQLSMIKQEADLKIEANTSGGSTAKPSSSSSGKRKAVPDVSIPTVQPSIKRPCTTETIPSASSAQEKMVEDLVKKYLSRKPMTVKTLLKEIKSKLRRMDGVTPEMDNNLVNTIAVVIKRLHIDKQKVNDQTYLWLKS